MIGGADLVGALGPGPGRRCPPPDRGRLRAWSWCPFQQDRRDDGHLQPGVLGVDQGGAQSPRQRVWGGGPV